MRLIFSTNSGMIGTVLTIFGILFTIGGAITNVPNALPGGIVLLVAGLAILIQDIIYLLRDKNDIWKKWNNIPEKARPQDENARQWADGVKFKTINAKQCYGIIYGDVGEKYITTLVNCTCSDYKKRRFPCKHMYKLAMELGVYTAPSTSDETAS